MSYWNIQSPTPEQSNGDSKLIKRAYGDREEFARYNPEIAAEQEKKGNKNIRRFIVLVSLAVASVSGAYYLKNTNSEDVPKTPVVKNQK